MTREEAIEFGKMWLELQEDCKDSNTYEFFKMAVEALKQEPTYTSEVAQKAYEDGKKDGYIQRKIETITENDSRKDCISRKAVIDAINANCIRENEYNLTSSRIKKEVENLPSVTPQEQRKEHWIEHPHERGINWEYSMYECSKCHEWAEDDSDFCPNCGADMREEQE